MLSGKAVLRMDGMGGSSKVMLRDFTPSPSYFGEVCCSSQPGLTTASLAQCHSGQLMIGVTNGIMKQTLPLQKMNQSITTSPLINHQS